MRFYTKEHAGRFIALVATVSLLACSLDVADKRGRGDDDEDDAPKGDDELGGTADGPGEKSEDSAGGGDFSAPKYGDDLKSGSVEDGKFDFAAHVKQRQSGGALAAFVTGTLGGVLTLATGRKIQLSEVSLNACPKSLGDCDEIDSKKLGIGESALVAQIAELEDGLSEQGDRNTCAAVVLTDATELLAKRDGKAPDLSVQHAYFIGKSLPGSWNSPGLVPEAYVEGLVKAATPFVASDLWPYNGDKSCAKYIDQHPDATCSESEAQGGGDDKKSPDPRTVKAAGFVVKRAHQLYASVGRVKQALYQGYPVFVSLSANKDFQAAEIRAGVVSWIYKDADCPAGACGHGVLAVGYQDDPKIQGGGYVLIRNSWGKEWGQGGFAMLTYEWLAHSIKDAQAIVAVEAVKP